MIKKYESIVEVLTPLHTSGNEKTGSTPVLRTVFIQTEYGEIPMPYVSGNSLRGRLRRYLMIDFLNLLGIDPNEISKTMYHSLFSGGALEAGDEGEQVIDLDFRREFRQKIVPISLFGCSIKNQMIPGKMKVSHLFPICLEYQKFLPPHIIEKVGGLRSIREYTDEVFFTRRDDLKAKREEDEQAIQMKVDYEVFVPGTKFYSFFILEYPNEIELSCFARMLKLFELSPFLGGKSNIGDGEVRFDYGLDITDEKYLQYVEENKDEIRKFIKAIS